jgi:hypothetical protein
MIERARIALIDVTGGIRFERLQRVAAAIEQQIRKDVGSFWRVDARITAMHHGDEVPRGVWPVKIVPDAHGHGGFHFDEDGQPYAHIGAGPHWTMSASHEILEMVFDPLGNHMRAAPAIELRSGAVHNARGRARYLMEICDPCESADFAYKIGDVVVSDFCTPYYYDDVEARPGRRYSFTGSITAPRQVPKGGYLCWFNPRLGKMQMLRNLARDRAPRIHTFDEGMPKRRSVREYVDGRLHSMRRLAQASQDHPIFHAGR